MTESWPIRLPAALSPTISVLVPCRDEASYIEACLRSILSQEPSQGGFEIIVADGMSRDGTRAIVERLAAEDRRITLIDNPAGIAATGLNAAIRAARGHFLARMDAHTTYASDYLRRCVELLVAGRADNVGGPYRTATTGRRHRAIGATLESMFAVGKQRSRQVDYEGHTDTVFFGCWRRDAFDRFGLFDETLVRNQDDEHNLRIVRAGGKIWQSPGICAWQRPRSSFRMLFRQYFGYGYWKVPVIKKHRVPASARHLVPGLFVLTVLALPALALCWRPASLIWASLLTVYALGVLAAAARTAARAGWDLLPWLPAGFGTVHFAYGLGFLAGAIDYGVVDGLIRKTAVGATLIGRRLDA